jgi:nitronate monooxygenase
MTTLRWLLGIEHPVLQAPMAGVQDAALAMAVSRAGGLGALPCALLGLDAIRAEVARVRAAGVERFNLNFFCHADVAPDEAKDRAWRALLAPYDRELGIDRANAPSVPRGGPFGEAQAALIEELRPPVVSFHFGLPSEALVRRVKLAGALVISSATTVDEARWLEENGADAIIAQGLEAGGHRGHFLSHELTRQMGTLALVAQIAAAVKVPVIAAGGIADARGVAAALALGASGVQVGTAYLSTPEAKTTPLHRAALRTERAHHTALTNLFTGRPARAIVNRVVRELGPLRDDLDAFPHPATPLGALRAAAEAAGQGDFTPMWAGQHVIDHGLDATALTQSLAQAITTHDAATPLADHVDAALYFAWDPIKVRGVAPRDEYRSYVPTILALLERHADVDELTRALREFRTQNMALQPDDACDRAVAEQLHRLTPR